MTTRHSIESKDSWTSPRGTRNIDITMDEALARASDAFKALTTPRQTFKFAITSCSECGRDFGPGDHGFSHCKDHQPSARAEISAALEAEAAKTAAWLLTQHRDGIVPPAEKIVLDCLRALHAIPDADRMYRDELIDVIARGFLDTAWGVRNHKRRAFALLRIAGKSAI